MTSRPARPSDIDEIAMSLPEVVLGTSWGGRPTYLVRGKGFLLFRAPHTTATDPVTGELWDDLLVIHTPSMEAKEALVSDPRTPFFTVEHFRRSSAVLVRQSRLGEISRDELAEVIAEAWGCRAPAALVRAHLGTT